MSCACAPGLPEAPPSKLLFCQDLVLLAGGSEDLGGGREGNGGFPQDQPNSSWLRAGQKSDVSQQKVKGEFSEHLQRETQTGRPHEWERKRAGVLSLFRV